MTAAPTLNSRLKVLVSKAFRAEKLYSSIRGSQSENVGSPAMLSEIANDTRSKEWQKVHHNLRIALNDILSLGKNTSTIVSDLANLRQSFMERYQEAAASITDTIDNVNDASSRHEFAHAFKQSCQLIKLKAQAQANKIIADELTSILETSGHADAIETNTLNLALPTSNKEEDIQAQAAKTSSKPSQIPWCSSPKNQAEVFYGSNIIPLRRKVNAS